jgi:hypothetical protein
VLRSTLKLNALRKFISTLFFVNFAKQNNLLKTFINWDISTYGYRVGFDGATRSRAKPCAQVICRVLNMIAAAFPLRLQRSGRPAKTRQRDEFVM